MTILAIRSVALKSTTATAWKSAGVQFARRGRTTQQILNLRYAHILNLGKSTFHPTDQEIWDTYITEEREEDYLPMMWNLGYNIKPLLWPGETRKLLGDLMPPRPEDTSSPIDVWIKAPGAHGKGKFKKNVDQPLVLPREWDWQIHVTGQEYRLITVGHKLVQDFKRFGDNRDRSYEWIPMQDVNRELKDLARTAARMIQGNNVIAWDLIQQEDGQVFLFEGNTCPGLNAQTASRIATEMETQANALL